MASARDRLSANMAALSYALDMAKVPEKDTPLDIRIGSGRRPGPLERRRQSEEIASPEDMSLEYEPGKPFKNFGRMLAYSADIPLPYNFRQSAEAAEQARIDYANQNETFGGMADTFLAQMEENASTATTESLRRQYTQYAAQGRNAINAFAQQDASPEQRAAAWEQLVGLDAEARGMASAEAQDDAQQRRKVQLEQYQKSSTELLDTRSAVSQAVRDVENYNVGRQVLQGLRYDSPEMQQFLRSAGAGILAGGARSSSLGLGQIDPALGILEKYLTSSGGDLDPQVMDSLVNAIGRNNIVHGAALIKGLSESNQRIIDESPALDGMPAFGTIPFDIETPATDAWWQQHGDDTPVRDVIDIGTVKGILGVGVRKVGEGWEALTGGDQVDLGQVPVPVEPSPAVEEADVTRRRVQLPRRPPHVQNNARRPTR